MVGHLGFWPGIRESSTHCGRVEEEGTILWDKPVTIRAELTPVSFRVKSDHRMPAGCLPRTGELLSVEKTHGLDYRMIWWVIDKGSRLFL